MKTSIAISLVMASPAAAATECKAGTTHKADLTNLFCADSTATAASCSSGCCEADKMTCGGVGLQCEFGTYATNDDAWKSTKTTAYDQDKKTKDQKIFQKDCCKPVATCSSTLFTCPAGMKRKPNSGANSVAAVKCPGNQASCANSVCCETDENTCGGWFSKHNAVFCTAAGEFPKAAADAVLKDDTWTGIRNPTAGATIFTAPTWQTTCCSSAPTCSSTGYKCPAGSKYNKANAVKVCGVDAATNQYTPSACAKKTAACCVPDDYTCGGGHVFTCQSSQYDATKNSDNWKKKRLTANTAAAAAAQCCAEKATCAVAQCPSGWKKKANVDTLACPSDKKSCGEATARCCEVDTATCGGLKNSVNCPYGFYNEATYFTSDTPQKTVDAWNNRAATQATVNTACCTAKTVCESGATTTPGPAAVTTTPVAPARLYTEHKAAATKKKGDSALWLGAGAIMGMAALMGIQRMRASSVRSITNDIAIE